MKTTIIKIWQSFEKIYNKGIICSERNMQAYLYHELYMEIEKLDDWFIFVEPKIAINKPKKKHDRISGIFPDIILAQENQIKYIFELKYKPYGFAEYEKDFSNLSSMLEEKGDNTEIFLLTEPLTGDWNRKQTFRISEDLIVIQAVVANVESETFVNLRKIAKKYCLENCLVQLYGKVTYGEKAYFDFEDLTNE